jgi:predicted ester cyclase
MSAEENKAIYCRFVQEVLNQGNVAASDRFFAPEFVDHSLPPDMPGNVAGFKEWLKMFRTAFPDQRWELEVILAEGDLVAHHKRVWGTHTGEFMGLAPTGKRINTAEIGIIKFAHGRMVEFWGMFDEEKLKQQLGIVEVALSS